MAFGQPNTDWIYTVDKPQAWGTYDDVRGLQTDLVLITDMDPNKNNWGQVKSGWRYGGYWVPITREQIPTDTPDDIDAEWDAVQRWIDQNKVEPYKGSRHVKNEPGKLGNCTWTWIRTHEYLKDNKLRG